MSPLTTLPAELQQLLTAVATRLGQSEAEVISRALRQYALQQSDHWPRSIGMGWDPEVTGANSEDWLRDNWHPD